MKRFFAVLLAVLMVLSLAACGGETKRSSKKDKKDKEKTTGVVTATVPVETGNVDVTVEPVDQGVTGDAVFNTSDYALTVTSVDLDDSYYGVNIKFKAENKTADKKYTIMLDKFVVNGVDFEGTCYVDVEGGEVKNDKASVSREDLEMAGITTVTSYEATFYIQDENYDRVETKTYSFGEKTTYTRADQSTDKILYNENGLKVVLISKGFEKDDLDYKMIFYIENKSNFETYVNVDNTTVNDKEVFYYFGSTLQPGSCTFTDINVYDFDFEDIGVKKEADVKNFKFDLSVMDYENYDDIANIPVTVTP